MPLRSTGYRDDLNRDAEDFKGTLADGFVELVGEVWSNKPASVVVPRAMKALAAKLHPVGQFAGYYQHDAQEFMTSLLTSLNDDLNRVRQKLPFDEFDHWEGEEDAAKADRTLASLIKHEDSIIRDLFSGLQRSRIVCPCGHANSTFDECYDVSVPIDDVNDDGKQTIEACLTAFAEPEEVPYTCPRCKKRRNVTKQISLYRSPRVLVVHVKRPSNISLITYCIAYALHVIRAACHSDMYS